MTLKNKFIWIFLFVTLLSLKSIDGDGLRLPDQQNVPIINQQQTQKEQIFFQQPNNNQQQQQQQLLQQTPAVQQIPVQQANVIGEGRRQGKGILDFVGLGTGPNVDPYVAKTNQNCLTGDLAECFKTHALTNFNDIFVRDSYKLTNYARVVRTDETQQRALWQEPFEFSTEPRSSDSEWEQLLKFGLRKVERFIKSGALEVDVPEELTEGGRYSPRFIDDINSEIDVIEDKGAPLFKRHRLKKLFIPLLLVLKIFKLKLLLFLPFILGLVGLKKILGLAAIILPGLFAYFKLCNPQQNFGGLFSGNNHHFPQYSAHGLGSGNFQHYHQHLEQQQHHGGGGGGNPFYRDESSFSKPYLEYYSKNAASNLNNNNNNNNNGIRFGGEHQQDLAYQGYSEYRTNNKNINE